ncbi:MAG: ABC transporter permease [Anaerolineales bacterium]|nr:ABC transporter permease [Anaerolineales bacterium]
MSRNNFARFVLDHLIWFILLLVILFFGWRIGLEKYVAPSNVVNIFIHASVLGVLTIGQTLVLLSGNFDLSAEGTLSLVTVLAAWLMLPYSAVATAQRGGIGWEVTPFIVIPLMMVIGLGVGWINGFFITRLNMNNFIVTLSMQLILRGLATVISMGAIMPGTPALFNWLGGGRIWILPVSVIFMLILFVFFSYVVKNTRFGRQLYAVGGNRDAARLRL